MSRKYYIPITRSGSSILASVGTQALRHDPQGCGCLIIIGALSLVLMIIWAVIVLIMQWTVGI